MSQIRKADFGGERVDDAETFHGMLLIMLKKGEDFTIRIYDLQQGLDWVRTYRQSYSTFWLNFFS